MLPVHWAQAVLEQQVVEAAPEAAVTEEATATAQLQAAFRGPEQLLQWLQPMPQLALQAIGSLHRSLTTFRVCITLQCLRCRQLAPPLLARCHGATTAEPTP